MAPDTAFALAGLGGFNAHGAGFLQAAREHGYRPRLVTATSGQIVVLAQYLAGVADLKAGLVDRSREANPFAQLTTALLGYPNVFRPAYGEAVARMLSPPTFSDGILGLVADRMAPAQQYVPTRPDEEIEELAALFDAPTHLGGPQIGVVFNAYDPVTGEGILYGNACARELMNEKSNLPANASGDVRYDASKRKEARVREITPEAIKSALWLSLYGFEGMPAGQMDGAYHRSCILSELHSFPRVIVARPLANGWLKPDLPTNYYEVKDWECEMWFSVGYKAEVDAMKRVNAMIDKLLQGGAVTEQALAAQNLRRVDLHEVAPITPAGYFNFFIEQQEVFDRAKSDAAKLFEKLVKIDAGSGIAPRGSRRQLQAAAR